MDVDRARAQRRTWETIASSFDATRTRPWRPVVEFLQALAPKARVLDAGCGNGRHLAAARQHGAAPVGLDFSVGLLKAARQKAQEAPVAIGLIERPPFKPHSFDAVLCIAAMHHVAGRAARVDAWRRLRVLARPQGALLASAWLLDQPRFRNPPPRTPVDPEPGDALVAWTQDGLKQDRFVHLYQRGELASELREAGWRRDREWLEALVGPDPDNAFVTASP